MTDSGFLTLSLTHPESAFLYNATKPRARLDGAELPIDGWGRHRLPVPAGPHRLQIWVPYVLPRKAGRAALDIVVPVGGTLDLEYVAPTFTMARGSLGTPGEQSSTRLGPVRILNWVAVAVVVIGLIFVAVTR